jgi:hypothetical protein
MDAAVTGDVPPVIADFAFEREIAVIALHAAGLVSAKRWPTSWRIAHD